MPNAIQQIQYQDANSFPITPDGGVYDLVFSGQTTADINFDAINSDIGSALNGLSTINGDADVEGTSPTFTCEFINSLGNQAQPLITVVNDSLTLSQNAISVTTTTPASDSASQASFQCGAPGALNGSYTIQGQPGSFGTTPMPIVVPVVQSTNPATASGVQSAFDTALGTGTTVITNVGGVADQWLVTFTGSNGQSPFTGGVSPSVILDATDSQTAYANSPIDGSLGFQIDTISLAANVNSGEWHVGTQTGIAYNDAGSGVQSAIETYLGITGGTIGGSPGAWTYQYGTPGDQTANTAILVSNTAGDTLTEPVSVNIVTTQEGGGGSVAKLGISVSNSTLTAGGTSNVTVTAEDSLGGIVTGYSDAVTLSDSLGGATFTSNPLSSFSSGLATTTATLHKAGVQTITGIDNTATISGTSGAITVSFASPSQLIVAAAASSLTAGQTSTVTITAEDSSNNIVTNYGNSVTLSDSSGGGLFGPVSFVNGTASVATTLTTAATQKITATDNTATIVGTSGAITVSPAAASKLVLAGSPTSITAGQTSIVSVTAQDQFGNINTGFSDSVTLSDTIGGSNSYSANPISSFSSGIGSSTINFSTAGTHLITATDSTATIGGTSSGITVSAAAATHLSFFASPPSTVSAGVGFHVTVVGNDSHGNTSPAFTSNVTLAINTNPGASTLGGTTVVAASSGVATFTDITLNNTGVGYKLSAASSVTGATSGAFTVRIAPVNTGGAGLSGLSGLSGESGMISI